MHQQIDRTDRVAELIKRELALLIPRELNDSRINTVTVTAVTVSRDLKQSTIFVSSMEESPDPKKLEKQLNKSAGYLRHLLSQNLEMRVVPALTFKYDASIHRGVKMSKLIDKLNSPNGV